MTTASNINDKIQIIGQGIDTGESFQKHARTHISEHTSKYWTNIRDIKVFTKKTKHLFKVEVVLDLSHNAKPMIGEYRHENIYTALNQAFEKCEKQMRRLKRKVKDEHR